MKPVATSYQATKARTHTITRLPWHRLTLLIVLAYEAAGGLAGGLLLIIKPDGRLMKMPVDIMHGVFTDFLIPGMILFGMGILSSVAFVAAIRRKKSDWLLAGITLIGWVIWFMTEIIILQELHWLHIMWGVPVMLGIVATFPLIISRNDTRLMKKALLWSGIFSSLWYVIINVYVPTQYPGYSISSYTVSELSAIGAPTRLLWVLLVVFYPLLLAGFGWGIIRSAGGNRLLSLVGGMIIAYCIFNFYWPPMHMRGNEPALTDTLHILWSVVTVLMMIVMMGFGAGTLGRWFRIYTIASLALLMLFGILTGVEARNIPGNEPTPLIGIWERINIALFMLWIAVLALLLLKKGRERDIRTQRSHTSSIEIK